MSGRESSAKSARTESPDHMSSRESSAKSSHTDDHLSRRAAKKTKFADYVLY